MDEKRNRVVATLIYLSALLFIQHYVVGGILPVDQRSIWLASGAVSLILGSRILTPHYTPPGESAANLMLGIIAILAITAAPEIPIAATISAYSALIIFFCTLVLAVLVLLRKTNSLTPTENWIVISERIAKGLGGPKIVFSWIVLISVLAFHSTNPSEVAAILTAWFVVSAMDPVEAVLDFINWATKQFLKSSPKIVGKVAAYQIPGLVLIRQDDEIRHPLGKLLALSDDKGPTMLGVALNYVGRDDGVLLRALSLKAPPAMRTRVEKAAIGSRFATSVEVDEADRRELLALNRIGALCGIVDSGTDIRSMQIEVVDDKNIEEGRLVDVKIGDEYVIYQIIDGLLQEDSVREKNKYGYTKATAQKIGVWNAEKEKFSSKPWMPIINSPVILKDASEFEYRKQAIGHFPKTDYFASVNISEVVTHNTAILGILGVGKSFLAFELIERMISESIKPIVLDLTDQHAVELSDFTDEDYTNTFIGRLHEAAKGRPVNQGQDEGGSRLKFFSELKNAVAEHLDPKNDKKLLILNPSIFRVSKQTSFEKNGSAGFIDLTPSEITALFATAMLEACQNLGAVDKARACLILEEAHSLAPEWNSVAADGDKAATAATSRAILQGRKFGFGCVAITQRTANVTKTILNQCNTVFAMRTYDDTGREFLGNFIGRHYASVLPNLSDRHAVLFGKASSCDDPVLLRLNDQNKFRAAFRTQSA